MSSSRRLDSVCAITMGQAPAGSSYNTNGLGLPLIAGAGDFDRDRPLAKKFTTEARKLCRSGDIVLGIRASIGEKVMADREYCLGRGVAGIRAGDDLDWRYLWHWLSHSAPVLASKAKGATFKQVNREDIGSLRIDCPPLPEQRRIAAILDQADALRAKRREALAKLDELTQAIFLDMFGDPATNPKGWPTSRLDVLFEILRGGSPRPIDDYVTDDPSGINWVMIGDASEGSKYITRTRKRIRLEGTKKSRAVKPGDFLLTNSMSFGRPYIMKTTGCIHDGWLAMSPRGGAFEPDYFYALLGSPAIFREFERRAAGATVKNLNIDLVSEVSVPVPPLEAQARFSRSVNAIEVLRAAQSAALSISDQLFASLQHRAFRGEL